MKTINILVGSTLGGTEYVAESAQSFLDAAGYQTVIHFNPDLDLLSFDSEQCWLICLSTHGAGDYPENFKPFVLQISSSSDDYSKVRFGLVGVGDSNYDTFCSAAINFQQLLEEKGANRLGSFFKIDVVDSPIPEDRVEDWIPTWINDLKGI